jgi:glutathione S-transferase
MLTLYHRPQTRSSRFIFLLEELGVPYEIKLVHTRTREGGEPDPSNPHPLGKVPCLSDENTVVFESPAIALYLTDRYPERKLGPAVGEPERGAYLSWLVYMTSVLEPAVMSKLTNTQVLRGTAGWLPVEDSVAPIVRQLSSTPYLLGERFSAVDILYGTTFAMFRGSPLVPSSAVLDDYASRVVGRPAFARAQARDQG